jgi:hypothetical protein
MDNTYAPRNNNKLEIQCICIMQRKKYMTTENLPAIQGNNFPSQVDLQSVALIARTAHASQMYSGVGGEARIMMILLAAKELGVGPCQALNGGIWAIQGKIEISARLMNGLIRRAGHSIKIVRSDDECCTLLGTRTDGDSFQVSFTKADAEKAGLWGSNTGKKYPADMLYNRCMSRLGRRLFSDVIGQCYIEGEIKEAKDVEKLEKAECEKIKQSTPNIDTNLDHFQPDTNMEQKEPLPETELKISFEDCMTLVKFYDQTSKEFRGNFDKNLLEKLGIKELKDLPAKYFHASMTAITRNIEMQQSEVANANN